MSQGLFRDWRPRRLIALIEPLRRSVGSLKLRLALASGLIIALSAVAITHSVVSRSARDVEQALLDGEAAHAERLASVLQQRVVRLQTVLRAATSTLNLGALADPAAQLRYLQERHELAALFPTVSLVDARGRLLAVRDDAGTRHVNVSVADRVYFRQTLEQRRSLVSEPIVGRVSKEPVVLLTMPVIGPDAQVAAMLLGTLKLGSNDLLADLTGTRSDGPEPMQTVVTNAEGVILAHADPALILQPAESVPGLHAAVLRWRESGQPIEPLPLAMHADGFVVAQAGAAAVDWMVFRFGPGEVLLGGIDRAVSRALWFVGGMAALATVLLWLWLAWLLRPLDRLEDRARALGSKDLPLEEGWPDARGEVGELEQALRAALRQRSRAEAATSALVDKLRSVMAMAPMGLAFTRSHHFEVVSDEWCRLFGYPPGGLAGRPSRQLYASDEEYEALRPRVAEAFAQGRPFVGDCPFVRQDGSRFVGELHGQRVNPADPSAGSIWLLRDVTQEREAHRELAWSANHDALTGLVNRRHFERELGRLLARPSADITACALFIDLDRFKRVNDTAGHAAGDQVLREVAQALQSSVRRDEMVARLGGDEFAIVLKHCDLASALRVAEKARLAIERRQVHWGEHRFSVGASVGVVELPASGADLASVMAAADAACYEAKQAGRGAVRSGMVESAAALAAPVGRGHRGDR